MDYIIYIVVVAVLAGAAWMAYRWYFAKNSSDMMSGNYDRVPEEPMQSASTEGNVGQESAAPSNENEVR